MPAKYQDSFKDTVLNGSSNNSKQRFVRNQFNAHFTFNFLNFCYAKVHKSEPEVARSMELFAEVLRHSIQANSSEHVSLKREIKFVKRYIRLHQLLCADAYIDFEISGIPQYQRVPPGIFISLIENAIKHGVTDDSDNPVRIKLDMDESFIALKVTNTYSSSDHASWSTGTGISNLQDQLQLYFADRHRLTFQKLSDQYQADLIIWSATKEV